MLEKSISKVVTYTVHKVVKKTENSKYKKEISQ